MTKTERILQKTIYNLLKESKADKKELAKKLDLIIKNLQIIRDYHIKRQEESKGIITEDFLEEYPPRGRKAYF